MAAVPNSLSFLGRGGEMGARIRVHDWSKTPLGPPERWTRALRILVRFLLDTCQPACVFWGEQATCLYNDAYRAALDDGRHPNALGQPAAATWAEIWPLIGPRIEQVMRGCGGTCHEDQALHLTRDGQRHETFWTYSLNPIDDEDAGGVGGVLVVCTETTEHVLMARRLTEENENRYRFFQRLPGFIGVLRGPHHVYEYVNDAYMNFAGQRELIGRPVRESFPDLQGQGFFEMLDGVYATGDPVVLHETPVRLQGEDHDRYIDLRYDPTYDEAGAVNGIFVSGYDLTERVRAEARRATLAELSEHLRELARPSDIAFVASELLGRTMNVSRAGYGTVDPLTNTLLVDRDWSAPGIEPLPAALRLRDYGTSIDDLEKGAVVAVVDARLDARTEAATAALEHQSARAFVNAPVIEHGDLVAMLYASHAEPRRWSSEDIAFVREFAERTRTAVERSRSDAALRALTASLEEQVESRTRERDRLWETSEDLLAIAGYAGELFRISPSWTRLLGHDEQVLLSRSYMEFVHPDDAANVVEKMQGMLASGMPVRFQNRFRAADGTWRWLSWSLAPEPDVDRVIAVGRDTTAEHDAADERAMLEEQLRQSQKMEAVGQLTGGIAHDFNNIVQGITGSLQIATRRLDQGRVEDLAPFMARAITSANRAAALTHRLLAFSRRQPLDPRVVDADMLLASLEDLFRRTIGESIGLEIEGTRHLWATLCDPNQLESSMLNLVLNARDAMVHGGTLTIRTANVRVDDDQAAELADSRPGDYVVIDVIDTGVGMSAEIIAQAFDPFFTTKPMGRGTGLGLSMVYGFARQSEGFARIISTPAIGTTVRLYLPRHAGDPAPVPVQQEPRREAARGHGETVLVIEDDPIVRNVVLNILTELGYRTLNASEGLRGLALLQSPDPIDLLVTDIGLPGLDGRQIAEAARRARPDLRILFMTGYAENAALPSGFMGEGMQMIIKPFPIDAFTARVQSMLASSASADRPVIAT
jgi:PAS domain S-box-containing protein